MALQDIWNEGLRVLFALDVSAQVILAVGGKASNRRKTSLHPLYSFCYCEPQNRNLPVSHKAFDNTSEQEVSEFIPPSEVSPNSYMEVR